MFGLGQGIAVNT